MEHPGADSLMHTVRMLNEIGRRTRSGKPAIEEYLTKIATDPTTEWFTDLLRDKSNEIEQERQERRRLVRALQSWYEAKETALYGRPATDPDVQLLETLRNLGVNLAGHAE